MESQRSLCCGSFGRLERGKNSIPFSWVFCGILQGMVSSPVGEIPRAGKNNMVLLDLIGG